MKAEASTLRYRTWDVICIYMNKKTHTSLKRSSPAIASAAVPGRNIETWAGMSVAVMPAFTISRGWRRSHVSLHGRPQLGDLFRPQIPALTKMRV